jgi:Raf kinase inhibitor-like YbhB/YbcL family protein
MNITSNAIQANDEILPEYTCDGKNISPSLTFSEIPDGAKSLMLMLKDPDAPNGIFTHWMLYDLSPATLQLVEGQPALTGKTGTNDFGNQGYGGPCPPAGMQHRYFFRLYALDTTLDLPEGATRQTVLDAMAGHEIASAELMGTYTKVQ